MTSFVCKIALGAVAALALAGSAQAADVDVSVRVGEVGSYHRSADFDRGDRDDFRRPDRMERHDRVERREHFREPDRFYGRPVFAGRGWGRHDEECRVIIKRRVNPWGDVIVRRTRVCG